MGVKISELNSVEELQNADVFPVVQGGETKKVSKTQLLGQIENQIATNIQDISNIKEEQQTQNTDIAKNKDDIENLNTTKANRTEIPTDLSQLSNATTKFVNETQLANAVQQETTARQNADVNLQGQIDAIVAQSDVVDVVGTYADLLGYDTSKITENDIVKVLNDNTHDNTTSYFRWKNNSWNYVGSEGPFYTKSETDERLNLKANQTSLDQTNDNLNTLSGRVGTNETEINGIKSEQTTQNRQIATLIADSGNKIELAINSQTYVLTATLKNKGGDILNTSNVDLPLEAMIVNATYDSTTKELVLTLQNGNTIRVSIADIVSGLVSQTDFNALEIRVQTAEGDITGIKAEQITQNTNITELQNRVTILENTVDSELEDGTATGTEISVTDSANAPAKLLPSGRTEQAQYKGYNLLNVPQTFNVTGYVNIKSLFPSLEVDQEYVVTWGEVTRGGDSNPAFVPGANVSWSQMTSNGSRTFTYTSEPTGIYIYSNGNNASASAGVTSTIKNLMIRKSSVEDTDWEPYVGNQPSPSPEYQQDIHVVKGHNEFLVQSKNWFDKDKILNIPATNWRRGQQNYFAYLELPSYFRTKFTASMSLKGISQNLVLGFANEIGLNVAISNRVLNNGTIISPKTLDFSNAEHVYLSIGNGNQMSSNLQEVADILNNYEIQVEKGETATSYVEHEENTADFTLEEGQSMFEGDYLADDGIHNKMKELILKGNEPSWNTGPSPSSGVALYVLDVSDIKIDNNGAGLSTHFINSNYNYMAGRLRFGWGDRRLYFYVAESDFPTLQDFKNWIATQYQNNNSVKVAYVLTTETITPYTETQQQQYNKLKKILSYYAGTNINTISAEDLQPILTFDYKKSSNLRIKALEQQNQSIISRLDLLES